jgi:c-di-GMP-binding flagellar brake protein YcgR
LERSEALTEQPPEPPQTERRKYPRSKIAIPIEFKPEGASVASRAETADLSPMGCYVEMSFTLPVSTKLDLVLWVEEERVVTKAIVVTHHPQFGNGIEFLNMSAENQAKLAQYLKMLEERSEEKPEASASG